MKKIKNILVASILTVSAFTATIMTSCNPDACNDVVCANAGVCEDGSCKCPVGYEGTTCETISREKFIKSWSASDVTGANTLVYTCAIASGTLINNVIVSNKFSDDYFVNNINATVNGSTITITSQQPDADGYAVAGTGTLTSGKISWNYTITEVATNSTLTYSGLWQ
jgi:hypothetical protein